MVNGDASEATHGVVYDESLDGEDGGGVGAKHYVVSEGGL